MSFLPSRCSAPSCRRVTRHPTRRCHDHRNGSVASSGPPPTLPPPPALDAPAHTLTYDDGSIRKLEWRLNGDLHRLGAPAEIEYYRDGSVKREEWRVHGRYYRDGGPAVSAFHEDGSVNREEWRMNGVLHRRGAPAAFVRSPDGVLIREEWRAHGVRHRIDGPSEVWRDPDGSLRGQEFYVAGTHVGSLREIGLQLRMQTPGQVRAELGHSPYAPFLDEGVEPTKIVDCLVAGVTTEAGIREVLGGAPPEWVAAYEASQS